MAGLTSTLYRLAFSKASSVAVLVISGAYLYERTQSLAADYIWDRINEGKQWKDIKHLYGG